MLLIILELLQYTMYTVNCVVDFCGCLIFSILYNWEWALELFVSRVI
jgi:hypothetical protein